MKYKLLIGLLFCCISVRSQNTLPDLESIVNNFLWDRDSESTNRGCNLFVLIFQTDAEGKIQSLNILSDESRHDSIYAMLRRISIADFKNWKGEPGKVIMLPLYTLPTQMHVADYADILFEKVLRQRQGNEKTVIRKNQLVITNTAVYFSPLPPHDSGRW